MTALTNRKRKEKTIKQTTKISTNEGTLNYNKQGKAKREKETKITRLKKKKINTSRIGWANLSTAPTNHKRKEKTIKQTAKTSKNEGTLNYNKQMDAKKEKETKTTRLEKKKITAHE